MAITTATSQQTTNATTSVATLPSTASAGDMALAIVGEDSGAVSNTWNNSFTELLDTAGTGFIAAAAYKSCAGGETSVTATHTTERSNHITILIPAAEWANDGTPPEITTAATGSSTQPNPPSISPSWGTANDTIFIAVMYADDSASPFPVTGWPTNYADNQTQNSTATSACDVAISIRKINAASDDPDAYTMTGTETWSAFTIAVKGLAAGGNVTVVPTEADLTVTGVIPVLDFGIIPPAGTLTLTGQVPVIDSGIIPASASLTVTGQVPVVTATANVTIVPDAAVLVLTGEVPVVTAGSGLTVVPGAASLTVTGQAPVVSTPVGVVPTAASLTVTGIAPLVSTPVAVIPFAASLALAGQAPVVTTTQNQLIVPIAASLTVTGVAPVVTGQVVSGGRSWRSYRSPIEDEDELLALLG